MLSPWLDLACTRSRHHPNAATDPYLPVGNLAAIAALLTPTGRPPASVLDADLSALPPVLIHAGTEEVLRGDAEDLVRRLHQAAVPARLKLWDGQMHVFQAFADLGAFLHAALTTTEVPSQWILRTSALAGGLGGEPRTVRGGR
ncbi:hypothetical protein ACRB68_50690 [Actinomadura sp. RB68]|uniref:Alpha/beta hydrolase fold-3 domain-containing protein n=1 Tax=Actinomadura macrotermitis TaxID=2585200 RepID=A0A7K0C1L5_9ACTN|nr:hypothetical protein [Actinomadura macrotermitis]